MRRTRDATMRARAARGSRRTRELDRLGRLYAALRQINQAIVWTRTREELFARVCEVLVQQGAFCMAWIGWHDPATRRLVPVGSAGDVIGYLDAVAVYTDDRPEGRGPAGRAFREEGSVVVNDLCAEPGPLPWQTELALRGWRASVALPIRFGGAVCGTLSVYADRRGYFQAQELSLLHEVGLDLSFALDNLAREVERQRAADAVHRFAAIVESTDDAIISKTLDGIITSWNPAAERMFGYRAAEILGQSVDVLTPPDRPGEAAAIVRRVQHGEHIRQFETFRVHKSGELVPVSTTHSPILGPPDPDCGLRPIVGVSTIVCDLSERRRAEENLRELNESLERKVIERTLDLEAARVRAEAADRVKSAFLATMSHELRTPLNSILGFTGIMLQGLAGPLNPEQSKQLGMVRGSARHLLDLINDVLDLSKIEAGQLEVRSAPFDLCASITRVIASVAPLAARKGLALKSVLPEGGAPMHSDRRRVEQILLNLVNNALKFTDHGSVTVTAEVVAEGSPAQSPGVRIQVVDTGIGMKPDDVTTLFQPFRQIDSGLQRQHDGTGLGLAICRRLAGLLGGTIGVESVWGEGSRFVVTLPRDGAVRP